MDLIIICHGFDFEDSNNANAHCLREIIPYFNVDENIIIHTTTLKENNYVYNKQNITVKYFSIKQFPNFKNSYIPWLNYIKSDLNNIPIYRLLTISFPVQSMLIGYELKKRNPNIIWAVYELDPYSYNKVLRLPKLLFWYRNFKQLKIFNKADKILLTHELYEQYNQSNIMVKFKKKYSNIGIPILEFSNSKSTKFTKNNRFVYIGTFYKKIREPFNMLEVMSELARRLPGFKLDIYGEDFKPEYEPYILKSENKIQFHGRISKEEVSKVINESGFLINVGNKVSNQLPSKVLEYIGYQKPILNFVSISNDPSIKYLEKYNYAMTLNYREISDLNVQINELLYFVSKVEMNEEIQNIIRNNFSEETVKQISLKIKTELFDLK